MKIVVCIKQVPDTTNIKVDPETGTLKRETAGTVMNPFDMYAVEEALRIREKVGGMLRITIGMGADEAVLLSDRLLAGSDTWATSYALAKAAEKLGCDIILFGKQAVDGDTAQVGPSTAQYMKMPSLTWVKKIREISATEITVERMMEDGTDVVKSTLPVALTVVKEINEPRLESLKGKMRAKKYEPQVLTLADIGGDPDMVGVKNSPTRVAKSWSATREAGNAELIEGDAAARAENLFGKLKTLGFIK
jgi:electron transfer flavoprotein beta subunit